MINRRKPSLLRLSEGRFVANVVDGRVNFYGRGEWKNPEVQQLFFSQCYNPPQEFPNENRYNKG
jgi:hypothetical protein